MVGQAIKQITELGDKLLSAEVLGQVTGDRNTQRCSALSKEMIQIATSGAERQRTIELEEEYRLLKGTAEQDAVSLEEAQAAFTVCAAKMHDERKQIMGALAEVLDDLKGNHICVCQCGCL